MFDIRRLNPPNIWRRVFSGPDFGVIRNADDFDGLNINPIVKKIYWYLECDRLQIRVQFTEMTSGWRSSCPKCLVNPVSRMRAQNRKRHAFVLPSGIIRGYRHAAPNRLLGLE